MSEQRPARRREAGRRGRLRAPRRRLPPRAAGPRATASSARRPTPRTPSRTRCSAPGAGSPRFEGRSSLRSWLYTVTTNASLKAIRRRPRRVLPIDYGPAADPHVPHPEPLAESVWVEPYPDEQLFVEDEAASPEARYELRESVELAFVAALQHLPPRQRAVLILRDVLGFSAREAAEVLETTRSRSTARCSGRTRRSSERLPEQSQQATLRALDDAELRRIVDGYMQAMESADVPAIAAMVADDVALSMPPLPSWYSGRDALATFLDEQARLGDWSRRMLATRANGQPAAAHYVWDEDADGVRPPRDPRARVARRPDRGDHRLRHAGVVRAVRPARADRGGLAASSCARTERPEI